MWEFQIGWGGISHLKPLRRYLRYFRGSHWWSSLSHRLLAFYTWMNRVTHCLFVAQCRSCGIGEWLKRLFCGHGRSCPPSSAFYWALYQKAQVNLISQILARMKTTQDHIEAIAKFRLYPRDVGLPALQGGHNACLKKKIKKKKHAK